MAESADRIHSSGLSTIAFLKAQIDAGSDHLGMFMPLVVDALSKTKLDQFSVTDIQDTIIEVHGLRVPQQTLTTLLRRVISKGILKREAGRYWKTGVEDAPLGRTISDKATIEIQQNNLAAQLQAHAKRRGVNLPDTNAALEAIIKFAQREHVSLLLNEPILARNSTHQDDVLNAVLAEFVSTIVANDPALSAVLNKMLEGLVLYHAAFTTNANPSAKTFKDLTVVFDSGLVRQAIGYEGEAASSLMSETIDVLKATGAECIVFDKTITEIHSILEMYREKLGTQVGRLSLRQVPMARHFLTQRYSPGDVAHMAALLEEDIKSVGLRIRTVPPRLPAYTSDESALARILADHVRQDEQEPRVVHDVDCVAGVLILRKGKRTTRIEEAKAIFATTSPFVLRNVSSWWHESEKESGIEPIAHIRALANIAWLKQPKIWEDFKLRELIALCAATMRPAQSTWDRFLRHLKALQEEKKLNSDETTALVVSSLSDQLLRDAELRQDGADEIDASTLDEIVDRVTATYKEGADKLINEANVAHDQETALLLQKLQDATNRAEAAERAVSKIKRENNIKIERRIRFLARSARYLVVAVPAILVILAAGVIFLDHHLPDGPAKYIIGGALIVFLILEVAGVLHHVSELSIKAESEITKILRRRIDNGIRKQPKSPWAK